MKMDFKSKLRQLINFGDISFKLEGSHEKIMGIIKDVQDDYLELFIGGNPSQKISHFIPLNKIMAIEVTEPR